MTPKRFLIFDQVAVDLISTKNLINTIISWIKERKKKKIFYTNVHTVVTAIKNKKVLEALNGADIVYPDGYGPILALRKKSERVNAADFIHDLLGKLNKNKIRIYLLGDNKVVLQSTVKTLIKKYENLQIVGFHEGFFGEEENKKLLKQINRSKPQLVMVAMGTPRQEKWVSENWNKLPNALYWCVGGLFNYIADTRKRAPFWMRKRSLEWLYRFFQEPKRLFYRYTIENIYFAWLFISSMFSFKNPNSKGGFPSS